MNARAIKSSIAVDMVNGINSKNCTIKTLVGDKDVTTISHVRSEVIKISKKE